MKRNYKFAFNGLLMYQTPHGSKVVFITVDPYHVHGAVWTMFFRDAEAIAIDYPYQRTCSLHPNMS